MRSLVAPIVEKFGFQVVPSTPEELDIKDKGISFRDGYYDGQTVDDLTLYADGIKLDLRSTTAQGQVMLTEMLAWLAEDFGLTFHSNTVTRWNFVSNVVFTSMMNLDLIHPALLTLTQRITEEMKGDQRVTSGFQVEGLKIDVDQTFGVKQMAGFTIERRAKVPYEQGKYFSAAPLPTDVHISLLEEFEQNLVGYSAK